MSHLSDWYDSSDPLAYLITWTTYGTWLPGDARTWILNGQGVQPPDSAREMEFLFRCDEDAVWLTREQRAIVEQTVRDHCQIRRWTCHEVNCRTNHCHAVIGAPVHPATVRAQLKAWSTRRLGELAATPRKQWWADRGHHEFLRTEADLEAAIRYVRDGQDDPRRY